MVPAAVPTMADAKAAGDALCTIGARRVLLYGSVARGDQRPDSDVDLVAVFDDPVDGRMSYDGLYRKAHEAVEAALGHCRYDLMMTDWVTWAARSRVRSLIEHDIQQEHVVLRDSEPPADIDWGREVMGPVDDEGTAEMLVVASASRLRTAAVVSLRSLRDDRDLSPSSELWRACDTCQDAAGAARLAVAAYLAAVHRARGRKRRGTGRFSEVWMELPPATAASLGRSMPVVPAELDQWGLGTGYGSPSQQAVRSMTWDSVVDVVTTAVFLCNFTAGAIGLVADVAPLSRVLSDPVLDRDFLASLRSRTPFTPDVLELHCSMLDY